MIKYKVCIAILLCFLGENLFSQQNDFQSWTSISIDYKINKKWQLKLSPELRLYENVNEINTIFLDLGAQYTVNSFFSIGIYNRNAAQKQLNNTYNFNHRWMFDVNIKKKVFRKCDLKYRLRMQNQFNEIDVNSFNNHSQSLRNKISLSYNLHKKISVEVGAELFNKFKNKSIQFSNLRLNTILEYEINKKNAIAFGFLYQKELNSVNPYTDWVLQIQFQKKLERKKPKKKKNDTQNL